MSNKRRKSEYLLSEIGGIDEGFLAEAESYRRRNPAWLKPTVAVACACLLVVGAVGAMMNGRFMVKGEASMDMMPENNMSVNGSGGNKYDENSNEIATESPNENGNSEASTDVDAEEITGLFPDENTNAATEECTNVATEEDTIFTTEETTEETIDSEPIVASDFAFECYIYSQTGESKKTFAIGDRIKIVTKLTNVGKDHTYVGAETDFRADIFLYIDLGDDILVIYPEPVASTEDYMPHVINSGESRTQDYYFVIPEDAKLGWYTAKLSYRGVGVKIADAIYIAAEGEEESSGEKSPIQEDNTTDYPTVEYDYSQTVISSGKGQINPISCFLYENGYDADGNGTYCADGYGVYWIFEMREYVCAEDFPMLVLDGEVKITSTPVNAYTTGSVSLYGLDFQRIEYSGGWSGLTDLPAGDYLVVYFEEYDSRGCNPEPQEYSIAGFECLFRLLVRE